MQIIIEEDFRKRITRVFLEESLGANTVVYGMKDGQLVAQSFRNDDPVAVEVAPLLEMPAHIFSAFKVSFLNHLSEQGIKTENENRLLGQLAATELHLKDLQASHHALIEVFRKAD